jgi:hypothetical protein
MIRGIDRNGLRNERGVKDVISRNSCYCIYESTQYYNFYLFHDE